MRAVMISLFVGYLSLVSALKLQKVQKGSCPAHVPIRGKTDDATGITRYTFKYAQAPRWQEAMLIDVPSRGVAFLDATQDGEKCIQGHCVACGWAVPKVPMAELKGGGWGSEDCLFLSIFALEEQRKTGKLMPAVFHIHHGQGLFGFKQDVGEFKHVVKTGIAGVSANYRLGAFGTFAHPDVRQPNMQISDVIQAMRWVRQYGCVAGVDPNRLTLTGSSSAGAMVGALLASPRAKGLFSGAWINHAVGMGHHAFHTQTPEEFYERHSKPCIEATECHTVALPMECMRGMPAKQLLNKFITSKTCSLSRYSDEVKKKGSKHIPGAPYDGDVVPNMLRASCGGEEMASSHVPLVLGTSEFEMDTLKFNLGNLEKEVVTNINDLVGFAKLPTVNMRNCVIDKMLTQQSAQNSAEDSSFNYGSYLFATNRGGPRDGPRYHFGLTAPASNTGRAWHTLAELLVWNSDIKENTLLYDAKVCKEFVMTNVSPALKDYVHNNFHTFIRTGRLADPNWLPTEPAAQGRLGGLPSNELTNEPDGKLHMINTYKHNNRTLKTMHSFTCLNKVPDVEDGFDLQECVDNNHGGASPMEWFKYHKSNLDVNAQDMHMKQKWLQSMLAPGNK